MLWAGSPFAHLIKFESGAPTGAISYTLYGNDGTTVLDSGTVTPPAGAVSHLLIVSGDDNTVATDLFESRTLTYNYATATTVVSGRVPYRVVKALPFPVSEEGVRQKLGVADHELDDSAIDLVLAYAELNAEIPLAGYSASGDRGALLALHAIEALAALHVLPTLQLAAAKMESSGTNEYQRFGLIDWDQLRADLLGHISRLREFDDPSVDGLGDVTIFVTAPRGTDEITGAART